MLQDQNLPETTQKLLKNPAALCNMVKRIAREAGAIIMAYHEGIRTFHVTEKQDHSVVTEADSEAEAHICAALAQITPGIPFFGEETVAKGSVFSLQQDSVFWLVDPLDGTRAFINGSADFTVNIALIKACQPVLGVVYAPAKEEIYAGHGQGTAVRGLLQNDRDKPIKIRTIPKAGLTVVSSHHHGDAQKLEKFLADFKVAKQVRYASSLKICAIAAGKADLYPRFGPTCFWDTAAAHAILNAAGGNLTDTNGYALRYYPEEGNWINPAFIASSFAWREYKENHDY